MPGFQQNGCTTPESQLGIPPKYDDDILGQSKHLALLKHNGIAFNLESKKEILRDVELMKKTVFRSGRNDKSNVLRNFKAIYEQENYNRVKNEFNDLALKK